MLNKKVIIIIKNLVFTTMCLNLYKKVKLKLWIYSLCTVCGHQYTAKPRVLPLETKVSFLEDASL